jgi:hypothetical protein
MPLRDVLDILLMIFASGVVVGGLAFAFYWGCAK